MPARKRPDARSASAAAFAGLSGLSGVNVPSVGNRAANQIEGEAVVRVVNVTADMGVLGQGLFLILRDFVVVKRELHIGRYGRIDVESLLADGPVQNTLHARR